MSDKKEITETAPIATTPKAKETELTADELDRVAGAAHIAEKIR